MDGRFWVVFILFIGQMVIWACYSIHWVDLVPFHRRIEISLGIHFVILFNVFTFDVGFIVQA